MRFCSFESFCWGGFNGMTSDPSRACWYKRSLYNSLTETNLDRWNGFLYVPSYYEGARLNKKVQTKRQFFVYWSSVLCLTSANFSYDGIKTEEMLYAPGKMVKSAQMTSWYFDLHPFSALTFFLFPKSLSSFFSLWIIFLLCWSDGHICDGCRLDMIYVWPQICKIIPWTVWTHFIIFVWCFCFPQPSLLRVEGLSSSSSSPPR